MTGRTKIVATIGPASDSAEVIGELIDAGADVMRLNLSHGTLDGHLERARPHPAVAAERGRTVAVLADLPGPEDPRRRLPRRRHPPGRRERPSQLASGNGPSDDRRITVPYPTLLEDLARRRSGAARRRCDRDAGDSRSVTSCATARLETGGEANGRPGVHLSSDRPAAAVADRARPRARRGGRRGRASSSSPCRSCGRRATSSRFAPWSAIGRSSWRRWRLSASVDQLHEIIAAADVVMVARGDLGHRLPDRGRAAPPEADRPPLRRGGRAGDHRDADARVDDHRAVADPRRGQRRRQRRLRRHRRRDAVG